MLALSRITSSAAMGGVPRTQFSPSDQLMPSPSPVQNLGVLGTKLADTVRFWLITTLVGFAKPVASPPQPANAWPGSGTAVSCTLLPIGYWGRARARSTPPPPPPVVGKR